MQMQHRMEADQWSCISHPASAAHLQCGNTCTLSSVPTSWTQTHHAVGMLPFMQVQGVCRKVSKQGSKDGMEQDAHCLVARSPS